jgi:hypothetical protein
MREKSFITLTPDRHREESEKIIIKLCQQGVLCKGPTVSYLYPKCIIAQSNIIFDDWATFFLLGMHQM